MVIRLLTWLLYDTVLRAIFFFLMTQFLSLGFLCGVYVLEMEGTQCVVFFPPRLGRLTAMQPHIKIASVLFFQILLFVKKCVKLKFFLNLNFDRQLISFVPFELKDKFSKKGLTR